MLRTQTVCLLLASFSFVVFSACDLTVPDENNPSLSELEEDPTPSSVSSLATGLLIGSRNGVGTYIVTAGMLGREMYDFDGASAIASEMLIGPLNPSGWGANNWESQYANLRNATLLLDALEGVEEFSEEEKEALRGYAKTIMAYDFLIVINARDENGAVIDIDRPPTDDPGPLVGKAQVFDHIASLLDDAQGHLNNAGGAFPFELSSGFAEFDTPQTFLLFNRALKARVDVYMGNYEDALQALDASFLDRSASLTKGVYHTFGTGSGDTRNDLYSESQGSSPNYVAPRIWRENAKSKPNGEPDDRFQNKFRELPGEQTRLGAATDLTFTVYDSPDSDIPIIRNEELILLRAEANIGLGRYEEAKEDLNFIRVNSGGLAPLDELNADNAIDELLYEKSYSLYLEDAHRWIDYRRYDRLDELIRERDDHVVHEAFPIPTAECQAQGEEVPCGAG